jgi:hypothetical protein
VHVICDGEWPICNSDPSSEHTYKHPQQYAWPSIGIEVCCWAGAGAVNVLKGMVVVAALKAHLFASGSLSSCSMMVFLERVLAMAFGRADWCVRVAAEQLIQ